MTPEPSTDLVVLDRVTGELVGVKTATTERLAAYVDALGELRAQLAESESVVNDELLHRMDFEAATTLHAGDWLLKVPSRSAGSDVYDGGLLQEELRVLLEGRRISADAASGALRRQLTLCLEVPWGAEPADLARRVEQALTIEVAGHPVNVLSVGAALVPVLAGINRLRKLGLGDALDAARVEPAATPRRRVKVTLVKERLA